MDDLIAFLRKEVARDEQSARALTHAVGEVRSRWSSESLLQEVDTKRQIIDFCAERLYHYDDGLDYTSVRVLELMALPYVDRQGFREEWKP